MGFFQFFKHPDIDQGIRDYREKKGAILLDVRTAEEYREGHIPDSKNIPLQRIENITGTAVNKNTPLFVYCYSGSRSNQAVAFLQRMGYSNVTNIGGIAAYTGKVVV